MNWSVLNAQVHKRDKPGIVGLLCEHVVVHVLHVLAHPLGGLLVVRQEPRVSPEVDGRQLLLKVTLTRGVVIKLESHFIKCLVLKMYLHQLCVQIHISCNVDKL